MRCINGMSHELNSSVKFMHAMDTAVCCRHVVPRVIHFPLVLSFIWSYTLTVACKLIGIMCRDPSNTTHNV